MVTVENPFSPQTVPTMLNATPEKDGPVTCTNSTAHFPENVASFLSDHRIEIERKVNQAFAKVGYYGDWLLQAGFDDESRPGYIDSNSPCVFIFIDRFLDSPNPREGNLAPWLVFQFIFTPYSVAIFTPRSALWLPPCWKTVLSRKNTVFSPVAIQPTILPGPPPSRRPPSHGTSTSSEKTLVSDHRAQKNIVKYDCEIENETFAIASESHSEWGDSADSTSEPKNDRRFLSLSLMAPLKIDTIPNAKTLGTAKPISSLSFNINATVELELSRNDAITDPVPGTSLPNLWYFINFAKVSIDSNTGRLYALTGFEMTLEVSPSDTELHFLPKSNPQKQGRKSKTDYDWKKFNFRLCTAGIGANLQESYFRDIPIERITPTKWWINQTRSQNPDKNTRTISCKYRQDPPDHNEGMEGRLQLTRENLEPGPHILLSTKSEDGRTLRIHVRSQWRSIHKAHIWFRQPKPCADSPEPEPRPPILANFVHEASFEVDLSKIDSNGREHATEENPTFHLPLEFTVIEAIKGTAKESIFSRSSCQVM